MSRSISSVSQIRDDTLGSVSERPIDPNRGTALFTTLDERLVMPESTTGWNAAEAAKAMETFSEAFVLPLLTGEWIMWEDQQQSRNFAAMLKALLGKDGLSTVMRQRFDEQLDAAQNVGKFADIERLRQQRNSESGPKVDPLAAALKALTNK